MEKVVCIQRKWKLDYCCKCPSYNEIVTVESVHTVYDHMYYYLVGFNDLTPNDGRRIDFNVVFFRPVKDIGDQVEEHINELLKKDLETVKA